MSEKAVLYVRVSTMEQVTKGVSLDAQNERLRAYCQMQGLEILQTYVEEGVSASKHLGCRPKGKKMLSVVKRKKAGHVVALKLDRLFRNAEDALKQTRAWDNAGVSLHLVDMGGQSLCTSSAMGRMMLTMMAAFAEFERNLISERTAMAISHKRSNGQAFNHTPFGFNRVGDLLEENLEEQAVIQTVLEWREERLTLQVIADKLNAEQIPTKHNATWHPSSIRQILKNSLHQ